MRRSPTTGIAASSRGVPPPARRMTSWASSSYVTGANSARFGYQYRELDLLDKDVANQTQLGYRFNQGVPNAVSYYLPDFGRRTITKTHSVFVQDSWTRSRLTLQGALRYDRASSLCAVRTERHDQHVVPESSADHDRAHAGRRRLQRHHAARGCRLRPLRQRQDGAQVQLGPLSGVRRQRLAVYLDQPRCDRRAQRPEPRLDRHRPRQGRGLRPAEPGAQRRNGDTCAAASGTAPNFGKLGAATQVDPGVLSGWGVRPHDDQTTVTVAAGADAARLGGRQLHAPHVPRLLRDRRPDAAGRHQLVSTRRTR